MAPNSSRSKAKTKTKPKTKTRTAPSTEPSSKRVTRSSSGSAPMEEPPAKKSKPSTPKSAAKPPKARQTNQESKSHAPPSQSNKTIIIEACKQCNSFKTRALEVQKGLTNGIPGIVVKINPEKPRRGCFEIREEDGQIFLSLLNMPRPFKKMKELDMDKVASGIIEKVK